MLRIWACAAAGVRTEGRDALSATTEARIVANQALRRGKWVDLKIESAVPNVETHSSVKKSERSISVKLSANFPLNQT